MSALDSYLAEHYLPADRFAAACGITADELFGLIRDRLVPAPSYTVSGSSTVRSYAFGTMDAPGSTDGQYFHPASAVWVDRARRVIAEAGRADAYEVLKERFATQLRAALAELNATTWRLRDSFDDDGSPIADGLRTRIDAVWEHFLNGTFGLCVADPVSEAAIARKEVLQEKLSALSENGAKSEFSEAEARELAGLVDAYAQSAMPFSPVEYPVSSRKRLVDDLRARIDAVLARAEATAGGAA